MIFVMMALIFFLVLEENYFSIIFAKAFLVQENVAR
jgi:hypothetical protein